MNQMPFDLVECPLVFSAPEMLSGGSAWIEHLPFAFAIVQMMKPVSIVELGTHAGDSYCGFCQAVKTLALPTRCFAIDTWQGDPQAGQYSDAVLNNLRAYHEPKYAAFSTLIQSTFAEALSRFEPGQIDLLHIDGLHTYEAVSQDFNDWLPKLSDRGVILFHDTMEKQDGFGVWKLWDSVTARYPHFHFRHEHGLGVLAVGKNVNDAVLALCNLEPAQADQIRNTFEAIGQRIRLFQSLSILQRQLNQQFSFLQQWSARKGLKTFNAPDGLLDPVQAAVCNGQLLQQLANV